MTGPGPRDSIQIDANTYADPDDLKTAITGGELCREIGNAAPLHQFASREVVSGNVKRKDLE